MVSLTSKYNKALLFISSAIILVIIAFGTFSPNCFASLMEWLLSHITSYFGDWFILLITTLTILYFLIAFSPFGKLKLGTQYEKKEFSDFSWFAMLFSCGIGVGFLFWGIAEPMTHFMVASPHNPYLPGDPAGYSSAMKVAVFHWGILGWVGYMALGVPIGYFAYRYQMPITTSSSLYGLLGRKMRGGWQFITDLISIFATVLGVATTIGMGLMTMSYGISSLIRVEVTTTILVILMLILVICYTLSAVSGIHKGVKNLSNINIYLCIALLLFIFFLGPTRYHIDLIIETTGCYLSDFIYMSFYTAASGEYDGWLNEWTIFYWCWFLSWGPFVGGFIAKISKGRSLRQYILGSILLPTIFTLIWFCVLGGTAMFDEANHIVSIWPALEENLGSGIFILLSSFPFTKLLSSIVLISLILFLITTADSASILCSMMVTKNGFSPSITLRCFWGSMIGITGMILLISGGLSAVQSSSTVAALPLSIIVALANISFVLALHRYEFKEGNNGLLTPYEQFSSIRDDIEFIYLSDRITQERENTSKSEVISNENKKN